MSQGLPCPTKKNNKNGTGFKEKLPHNLSALFCTSDFLRREMIIMTNCGFYCRKAFVIFPLCIFSLVCFIYWIDRWERKGVGFIDKVWYFCESLDFFLCAVWFKAVVAIISAKSKRQWSLELSRREAPLFLDRLSLCEHFVIPSWEEDSEEKSTIHNVVCGLK